MTSMVKVTVLDPGISGLLLWVPTRLRSARSKAATLKVATSWSSSSSTPGLPLPSSVTTSSFTGLSKLSVSGVESRSVPTGSPSLAISAKFLRVWPKVPSSSRSTMVTVVLVCAARAPTSSSGPLPWSCQALVLPVKAAVLSDATKVKPGCT